MLGIAYCMSEPKKAMNEIENPDVDLELCIKMSKELRGRAEKMEKPEARLLVDAYYSMQKQRIVFGNKVSAIERETDDGAETVLRWLHGNMHALEKQAGAALTRWSKKQPVCAWMMRHKGIGPVLSSGLYAHLDIERAPYAGCFWSFAGLNPTKTWDKGEKRPWNANLKTLCWKMGESFVKVSGYDDAFYGKVYLKRKEQEEQWNAEGRNKAAAEAGVKRVGKGTEAYKAYAQGILPAGHVHARAKRFAVKLFLSHLHAVWFEWHYKRPAPEPYAIAELGHEDWIKPPFGI